MKRILRVAKNITEVELDDELMTAGDICHVYHAKDATTHVTKAGNPGATSSGLYPPL